MSRSEQRTKWENNDGLVLGVPVNERESRQDKGITKLSLTRSSKCWARSVYGGLVFCLRRDAAVAVATGSACAEGSRSHRPQSCFEYATPVR
ncbi:unnamed protein product [Leptosia nina]|uniref:Uncharacterized protein n=1 Tax=Leptosia nina TaxID=320188 RepID=A0AAV1JLC6_9NEOP